MRAMKGERDACTEARSRGETTLRNTLMTDEHRDKREQRLRAIVHPGFSLLPPYVKTVKSSFYSSRMYLKRGVVTSRSVLSHFEKLSCPTGLSYIITVIENINFLHVPFNFLFYSENISLRKMTLPVKKTDEPEIIRRR